MFIRALAFLLLFCSTAQAAIGTLGGRQSGPPQIAFNLLSPPVGVIPVATCNGDVLTVTRTASITTGTKNLNVTVNTFASGDVGKNITIEGAGNSGGRYFGKIATFTDAQNVVLDTNATTTISALSTSITYGTSDAPAFDAFNNWARANQGSTNQVVLTIPNGSSCWFGNGTFNVINVFNAWAAGINNLIVEGTGATINSVGGRGFQLGGLGMCFQGLTATPGCDARIQTASAGSSTITLTADSFTAGYISRFSVGQVVMVGGLDPQALFQSSFGDPTNLAYFEWKKITAICNNTVGCSGTAVITLDSPLGDTYSSAWPGYNSGDQFHSDAGGPATVWAFNSTWETTVEYRGLTISQEGQTYAQGRNVTYRGVTFTGSNGAIPTQNESWSAINTDYGFTNMETDKLVGTMLFDGVTIAQVVNQSTATKRLIIRNSNITLRLDGGAQYTEITDSTLNNFGPGIFAYGTTGTANQTICTRCVITTLNYSMGYNNNGDQFWSKSGGVITMPNAAAQGSGPGQRYFVPGGQIYYTGFTTNPPTNPLFSCCESIGSFRVGAITSDPWPSVTDNQTLTTTVNITSASKSLNVPSGPFVSGDVGKTIIVNGAGSGGGQLRTWVTAFSSATDVTLYNAAASTVSSSQTIQWGTSNTYVQTTQSGGFPNISAFGTGAVSFKFQGSWNFTCDTCTGDPNAVGSSIQAGATAGKPLGSYISRTYTPSGVGLLGTLPGVGVFKSLRINVTVAATGSGSIWVQPGGQFHWYMTDQNTFLAPTTFDWAPSTNLAINLKQTGDRVITPSGITCNGVPGVCSGDNITLPTDLATMWLPNGSMNPYMAASFTTAPTFTMTLQTDPIQ